MKIDLTSVRVVFTLFFMLSAGFCFATTYYISPSGSDATGDGTPGNPWLTLYQATSSVTTPGDIIHVNAGTYIETQTCDLAVGVSLEGDGVTSILKSTLSADWLPLLSAVSNSEGTDGNQHISNLKFDGQNLTTFWAIEVVGRKNFSIYNCTIVDFNDRGVIFAGRVDDANAAPTIYATGNSFHDNIMSNCARYTQGYGAGCLNIGGQDGMLVYNNTITQDSRTPGNNGWPIKYWNDGYLDGCKIYNNTLNKIMCHSFLGDDCWDFAIELFNARGLEIYSNTINGGSIDLNHQDKGSYAFSVWIHHNLIQMPYINIFLQTGVTLEFESETALIEDNVFDKVNVGVNYTPRPGDAITNNTIRRNLMKNIGKAENTGYFIYFGGNDGNSLTYNNLDIFNNTMVMSTTDPPYWGIALPSVNSGSISNINIKNNIIQGALSGPITQYSNIGTDMLNISNNDTYLNGNNDEPDFTNVPPPTNYTYADNMIGVDPMFIGGDDYTLQSSSFLINTGIDVGLPYYGSAPDRGSSEYAGSLPIILIDFRGKENGGINLLNWNTASESNSSYFSIERSNDGRTYYSIGRVNASGSSSTEVKYGFTDFNPLPGVNYYRLVLVDKDGSSAYSKIVTITLKDNSSLGIIYIDLSTRANTASLILASKKSQTADLSIIDISGRTVYSSQVSLQKGNNAITRPIPALSGGIYYVKIFTKTGTIVKGAVSRN